MSTSNLIEVDNLSFGFKDKQLFNNLSLEINSGDFIMLRGENGSGKTTLVEFITKQRYSRRVTKGKKVVFSYVPQLSKFSGTAEEILKRHAFAFKLKGVDKVVEAFSINDIKDTSFEKLSSGEKQRVLLALSFLRKPDLIILDEFSKGLDDVAKEQFIQLIRNLRKKYDFAILMVSHNDDVIKQFKTTDWELVNGKVEVHNV